MDDVEQRLAAEHAANLIGGKADGTRSRTRGDAGDVGSEQEVGAAPEGMVGGQRLGIGDVERGADATRVKRFNEGVGVDDGSARGVDQKRALRQQSQLRRGDELMRGGRMREDEDENFRGGQKRVEFRDSVNRNRRGAGGAGDAGEFHAKGKDEMLDGLANGAVADKQDALAMQLFLLDGREGGVGVGMDARVDFGNLRTAAPVGIALEIVIPGEVFEHGENGGESPLCGGDVVRVLGVADGDAGGSERDEPVGAGHEAEDGVDAAQVRPDALSDGGRGRRNPEVDLVGLLGVGGDGHSFDFAREQGEKIGREGSGIADAHGILRDGYSRTKLRLIIHRAQPKLAQKPGKKGCVNAARAGSAAEAKQR